MNVHSFLRLVVRSFIRSFVWSFVRLFVRSVARSLVRLVGRSVRFPHRKHPNVLMVCYETLIADLEGSTRLLSKFCGVDCIDDTTIDRVVEQSTCVRACGRVGVSACGRAAPRRVPMQTFAQRHSHTHTLTWVCVVGD